MADAKLSALTALTGANVDPAADLLYIDDVSVTTGKKITVAELAIAAGAVAATQAQQETATSLVTAVTPGRQQFHPSSPKAWVNWTSAGGIDAGYNVSSVTDTGTGNFTVNFTVPFSSTAYCPIVSVRDTADSRIVGWTIVSASACQVVCRDASGTPQDSAGNYSAVFFGDQ